MSVIPEKVKDVEIKYVFVKSFQFFNPAEAEALSGHPRVGSVYRSVQNLHTKHHRLLLPDGVIMGFNQLVGESGGASFELAEINIDNILDYDIAEEDLQIFLHPNDDIFEQPPTIMIEGLQQQLEQSIEDEVDFSSRASDVVLSLFEINPVKAEVLIKVASFLLDSEMQSHEDAAYNLKLSSKGLGLNIGAALIHLDRYSSEDRRTSECEEDLLEAIGAIVLEMERVYN